MAENDKLKMELRAESGLNILLDLKYTYWIKT